MGVVHCAVLRMKLELVPCTDDVLAKLGANWRRLNDAEIKRKYDAMQELRRGCRLHAHVCALTVTHAWDSTLHHCNHRRHVRGHRGAI